MKRLTFAVALLATLASGCMYKSPKLGEEFKPVRPVPEGKAQVYFYYLGWHYVPEIGIQANEVPLTLLPFKSYFTFTAEPGLYRIKVIPYDRPGGLSYKNLNITYLFEADQEYFVEIDQTGTIYGIYLRTPDEALVELTLTREVGGTQGIPPAFTLYDIQEKPKPEEAP